MRKEISQGESIPAWYGVAWLKWETCATVCYPVPLNLIIAFLRGFLIWLRYGYRIMPCSPRDAYVQGFLDGQASLTRKED